MRQYLDTKASYPDAIVFFRLGDFYEMFYEDAVYVSRTLGLTLTTRDKGKENPIPMCGVPHHAARAYLTKLTDLGHRVALCEQLEDPKVTKGIVKRGVVRVVTPGVILDEESLDPRVPNYVAAAVGDAREGFGLAFVDVTTGDFRATMAPTLEGLIDEVARAEPREVVLSRDDTALALALRRAHGRVSQTLVATSGEASPLGVLGESLSGGDNRADLERFPALAAAAARVLAYVRATQMSAPLPVCRLEIFRRADYLVLDEQARAHLELTETMQERKRSGSLLDVLDVTCSPMGGRLLRRWLLFPLMDVAAIRRRHDAVDSLVGRQAAREAARKILGELGDIERLAGRARLGVASPRDLVALGRSLMRLPELAAALGDATDARGLLSMGADLPTELGEQILGTLRDDAPASTKDGGYIRPGVSAELDELVSIAAGGRDRILAIEARERERTGIPSLKVKYNSVFGYYIEITRAQLANVPADYIRKQTVANAERFVTPELGEYEATILSADERRVTIELQLFSALREEVGVSAERLMTVAGRVAAVDVLAALGEQAHRLGYVRPQVDDSAVIDLGDSRHPVVERLAAAGGFVPNDIRLDADNEQLLLVTGPNMAGKSTLIRQVALSVVLAQMGSFVPARTARIGICDRVFTRVGAGDNLARGESTFLVEMRETAHILRHATRQSLVVLDEIGRGTSTYDGVSIAWAVAEFVHDRLGARALFATHYHELCALADEHPRVRNVSVAAREGQGEVIFLRKLTPGGASRSFGIEVGKMAGLPAEIVARARAILATLEAGRQAPAAPQTIAPGQGALRSSWEDRAPVEVAEILRSVEPDDLSPRDAWALVVDLRKKLTPPH